MGAILIQATIRTFKTTLCGLFASITLPQQSNILGYVHVLGPETMLNSECGWRVPRKRLEPRMEAFLLEYYAPDHSELLSLLPRLLVPAGAVLQAQSSSVR